MIRRVAVFLALLPALMLQSGCSAINSLNAAATPLDIYELSTPAVEARAGRRTVELVIEEPIASGALATERIMIKPGPLQAQYLPGARWPDPAPEMLQTLILRTLLETGALGSVGRRPVGNTGDYALLSELTDFQAEETDEGANIRIRLILRIVRERDARVIVSRSLSVTEPVGSIRTPDIVAAFDRATARLLGELAPWVLGSIGA